MPWDKPVSRLREYILALRAIWDSFQSGESLSFEGDFYSHTLMTPFFNPGPIENPEIPIHIAGVNTRLAALAGELCNGFHVHPFHSPEYVRTTVISTIAEGARAEGRDPEQIELATSVMIVTGENEEEIEEERKMVRSQISFYASTPTYRTVLEAHGWEVVGEELGKLARDKRWNEMPGLVTDEMLGAFAVEATPDELGSALRKRYAGLIDRIALYIPFVPGERDDFWRTVVESVYSGS